MSNYRRLISYIYAYEGEVKGKNIGFAKLESRNNQCKINVSVKKVYVGSNDLGVYLLSTAGEIELGKIFIRSGTGEFRTSIDGENAENSGISIDQCYGLTIHDPENSWQNYTTIWEDAVAHAAEIELAGVTSENVRKKEEERKKGKPKEAELSKSEPPKTKFQELPEGESKPEPKPQKPEPEPQKSESEPEPQKPESEPEPQKPESEPEPQKPESEPEPQKPESEPKPQKPEPEPEPQKPEPEPKPQKPEPEPQEERSVTEPEPMISQQAVEEVPLPKEPDAEPENTEEKEGEPDYKILWEKFSSQYPKIDAFDYENGSEILRITPQDIGLLPRENWVYGNNSFLLHGYYSYRYLILIRLHNPNGRPRFLLGVPGHYFSNEKHMAFMFGFPHFVLSKNQPVEQGRFGYWYTDIKMGNR